MTTTSTPVLNDIADRWENQYKSGVNSGIVGDINHAREGGYHISIEDQSKSNYSVIRPDDKAPPGTWSRKTAAAIDQSMNRADMMLCYKRVHTVWVDRTDPRRKYFNAFNVWDGSGTAVRFDFVANTVFPATSDHTWHVHGELRRRYVNDKKAGRAWLSMTGGQTKAQWLMQEENKVVDDMALLLLQEKGQPAVYVTDGLQVRWIRNGKEFANIKTLTAVDTPKIIPAGTIGDWGVFIGPEPTLP